ncbi:MAG: PAS domain S-box protein [Pseudomonadota bacterium]
MKDPSRTDQELIEENSTLKQRIQELEQAESKYKWCEETLRLCIEHSPAAITMFDREMKYIAASRRYLIDYGLGEQSLVGRSHYDVFPELPDRWKEVHRRCLAGSIEKADQDPFPRADGRLDWVRWEIHPWKESGGRIGGIILFSEVITERKQAEEALKEEAIRRRILVEQSRDGIVVLDQNGKVYEANQRYADLLGYSMEEVLQLHVWDWDTQWTREQLMEMIRTVDETGDHFETRHLRKDGTFYDVEISTNGAICGGRKLVFCVCRDITDRKRAEAALTRNEEKFRKAFYTSPDSVNINRLEDGMYISINPGFTRIMGYTEEDIIGKTSIEYNIWENIEDRQKLVDGLRKDGEVINLEAVFRAKSGEIRYGLMSASVIDLDGVPHILSITRDITDRKRAEEALKDNEKKYRLLADNVNDVIFVLDMNLNYTYVSPSIKILRGYEPEEVLKQSSIETLTPSSRDLAMRTLSEIMKLERSEQREIPISQTLTLEVMRKDGTTVWTEVMFSLLRDENQRPMGILGVTRDITERKRAEEQLQHTLASLRKAVNATIQVMVSAVETRDPYTAGHQLRSADLARAIATDMGLPHEEIEGIRIAGSIHDIGKLSIPAEILSKPTKLSKIEFSLIQEHARKGFEILKDVESPWPLAEMVYQHHERMDGSGYPRNLKGEEILMEARILTVADVVEAMASHRPYRPGLGIDAALDEIKKSKGIFYDTAVVDACLRLFREKGYKFEGT